MAQQTSKRRNSPCILLVVALFFSSFLGVFPHPDENAVPLEAGLSHAVDVVHTHSDHPDGIFEFPQAFVGNGQGGLQAFVDGSISCVRSRHGLPLERPPELSLTLA